MNGKLICVCCTCDNSIFAFSAASCRRCFAMRSCARSTPCALLNCETSQSIMRWSQSSPPRTVSPCVLFTSNTPSPISKTLTSKVPPPRSNTKTVSSSPPLSRPYAKAAAVGSLIIRNTSRPAICPASFVAVRCASSKYAGTVITACVTVSPRYASASRFNFMSVRALISCGVYCLPSISGVFQFSPMWRFTERKVRSGLVMAWRLATSPTSTSPVFENATTDGVVRAPSELGMTTGSPASKTETTEFVVPRSIPTAFAMVGVPFS